MLRIGALVASHGWPPDQERIDRVAGESSHASIGQPRPSSRRRLSRPVPDRIAEAQELLRSLNFDAERQNERSALVLLALLAMEPTSPWSRSQNPMLRTVEIIGWISDRYARPYKPNTRETIRRQTLHQFLQAGLVSLNPDEPARPVNSRKSCYQVSAEALTAIRTFGSRSYGAHLAACRRCDPGSLLGTHGLASRRDSQSRSLTARPWNSRPEVRTRSSRR